MMGNRRSTREGKGRGAERAAGEKRFGEFGCGLLANYGLRRGRFIDVLLISLETASLTIRALFYRTLFRCFRFSVAPLGGRCKLIPAFELLVLPFLNCLRARLFLVLYCILPPRLTGLIVREVHNETYSHQPAGYIEEETECIAMVTLRGLGVLITPSHPYAVGMPYFMVAQAGVS
ncbi:hypothetical protein FS749_005115 [Ceratobasidium sp. UAMH 11750]|nr:hypothetical protein FS749_005115 [Ceratobasidium sp. UAMH 11750]